MSVNGTYGTLGVVDPNNNPGGRQIPVTWTDASGNLWLFGGYGFDSSGTVLPMNDVWEYSAGQWTWTGGSNLGGQNGTYGALGVPAMSNIPGARYEAASWTDSSGAVRVFGGNGFDSAGTEAALNDMWKYSNGEWTWMGGSDVAKQLGIYGTLGPATNNTPGARFGTVTWVDSSGNFWLFGGFGYDSNGSNGMLNELWKYSNGQWTWEYGSDVANQNGTYGTQGMPTPNNSPGARYWAAAGRIPRETSGSSVEPATALPAHLGPQRPMEIWQRPMDVGFRSVRNLQPGVWHRGGRRFRQYSRLATAGCQLDRLVREFLVIRRQRN